MLDLSFNHGSQLNTRMHALSANTYPIHGSCSPAFKHCDVASKSFDPYVFSKQWKGRLYIGLHFFEYLLFFNVF